MNYDPAPILLAEDDVHDSFFMERAFKIAEIPNRLIVLRNGQEAVWYLSGHDPYSDRDIYPEPRLLLLDLKMPLMDGFDVLAWIRDQPQWSGVLPVVVLSSSAYETDVRKALELGALEYLTKPNDLNGLVELVGALKCRLLQPCT